jgi:hypothetical protein
MTAMLELPDVTLACIDTRHPALALEALGRCRAQARFARTLLFTDTQLVPAAPPGVELVDVRIDSVAAYSRFLLQALAPHVRTSHVLVVQWDGFVIDASAWQPAFLAHDYIGAPWHDVPGDAGVGNGGFSLRSRRLLDALQDLPPAHPEDTCICRDHRAALEARGLRFAPRALAQAFAFERTPPAGPSFGFHGLFNFDRVLPRDELAPLLRRLPDAMFRGLDAHDLATRLLRAGRLDEAALIVAARRRLRMHDRRSWRLRARLAWARWRSRTAAPAA